MPFSRPSHNERRCSRCHLGAFHCHLTDLAMTWIEYFVMVSNPKIYGAGSAPFAMLGWVGNDLDCDSMRAIAKAIKTNIQGLKWYVNPTDAIGTTMVISGEMRYDASRRPSHQSGCLNID
jgi:hypothetical protein